MAVMRIGIEMLLTAHGVELLLEHQSTSSSASLARMAFALRNERTVISRAPPSKLAFRRSYPRAGRRTLSTIWVTTVPSFFSSFCGLSVL